MKKIVLTGGGTAGHVTPNIALIPGLISRGYEVSYVGSLNGIEKKPGLDELIAYGKDKGLRLAVATATDNVRTKLYLESIGVYHHFDKVVCGNMVKSSKPDPDIYLTASAELGLPPAECIALEDSPNGIHSAHSAGCVPVFVPDLSQPDEDTSALMYACCETLAHVIPVIEQLNRYNSQFRIHNS